MTAFAAAYCLVMVGIIIRCGIQIVRSRRVIRECEADIVRLERQGLDLSLRGAYIKGFRDATEGRNIALGVDAFVIEWRERYGNERREVRS